MNKTLYTDGVEVDASDLQNTENTKSQEIILSRQSVAHYGVIEGLTCANELNKISIAPGVVQFKNGEIGILKSPIVGISGASFDVGVSTFVGLRAVNTTSNPKPHEVDPTLHDTRETLILVAELFVAASNTSEDRQVALQNAINAEINDGNFVILAEFVGTGTGLGQSPAQNTPLPRSKGGFDPYRGDPKTFNQRQSLVSIYNASITDEYPIYSAEDHFHRSLIGSGIPSQKNPHGLTLTDIGGDALLDSAITRHQIEHHSNGIIGFEPPEDDFHPDSGSFAWSVDASSGTITIRDLVDIVTDNAKYNDTLVIQGRSRKKNEIGTFPVPLSLATKPANLYYIYIEWGSTDPQPTFKVIDKPTFDSYCEASDGKRMWLNNAVAPAPSNEQKFFVIGLVRWNGTQIVPIKNAPNTTIRLPAPTGDLVYKAEYPVGHSLRIPDNELRLDLRRWGTLTNEDIQRRSLRLDRLVEPVITEDMFVKHSGIRVVDNNIYVVSGAGLRAVVGSDNTTLKHLTDFDAFDLFGHRARVGTAQHGLSRHSGGLNPNGSPRDEDALYSGFQSSRDKWKQDNLTMTILSFADLRDISTEEERAMGNAAAIAGTDPIAYGSGGYIFYRKGVLKNFTAHLGTRPTGTLRRLVIRVLVRELGTNIGTFSGIATCQIWDTPEVTVFTQDVLGFDGGSPNTNISATNISDVIVVDASFSTPKVVQMTRRLDTNNPNWRNLSVTCEYHYDY